MFDLENADEAKAALESYDYKAMPWADFVNVDDLPEGLFGRAERVREAVVKEGADASWVVFDPLDNDDGWLLIGSQVEVCRETCAHLIDGELDEGPLAISLWPNWFTKVEDAA